MRIVAWNCNMSLRRKIEHLLALNPDILILSEVSKRDTEQIEAPFSVWMGSNLAKGLAVIAFGDHEFRLDERYTDGLPWFIPLSIPDLNLNLLGVWAHVKTPRLRYVRVTHEAIDHYAAFIQSAPTIIAGDFNSNTYWDKEHPKASHSRLVAKLDALGIKSLYHGQTGEAQGAESTNTLFMYRNPEKGYHIDYVFLSESLVDSAKFEVGTPDRWLHYSDHMPLIADIDISGW